jgi:galactose-6-phosphate isomerase
MAFLDVDDVITDPDFADSALSFERITQTIDDTGEAVNTPVSAAFSGVVCAADGSTMTRNPEGGMVATNITITTLTALTSGNDTTTPADIVTWRGARYTVKNTNDFQNFGRGYTRASCEIIPVAGG